MTLIARSIINGINNDDGLKALDGYMEYSANTNDPDELIDMFKKDNPLFRADKIEIVEESRGQNYDLS